MFKNGWRKLLKEHKGFAIIVAIFIVVALSSFVLLTTSLLSSSTDLAVKKQDSLQAFFIADTGYQSYLQQLKADDDWSSPPTQLSGVFKNGTFSVTTSNETEDGIEINSTATLTKEGQTYTRQLTMTISREIWGFMDEYVLYWGGVDGSSGTTQIGNNTLIDGDILANNDVNLGSGVTVSGDAYSSGNITGDTSGITGDNESQADMPSDPPSLETTYYDAFLATAATYPSGNVSWNNETLSSVASPYYINGDLAIGNNGTINITDNVVVVVTGDVTINNNATIGNNLTLIVEGSVVIENNVNVGSSCIFFSYPGFTINNNIESGTFAAGSGTSFLTPGDFNVWNNAEIYGLIYAGGTFSAHNSMDFYGNIIANHVDQISNNSELHLSPGLVDLSLLEGLTGGTEFLIRSWQEIY